MTRTTLPRRLPPPTVWLALAAALAMGLQEWLALSRSRWRDHGRRPAALGRDGGRAA
jgi:hypothetical protein